MQEPLDKRLKEALVKLDEALQAQAEPSAEFVQQVELLKEIIKEQVSHEDSNHSTC